MADEGAVTSVGSKRDSYDNALAESVIGLYKSELITMRGPWRTVDDVELATLTWVDWGNHRRLLWPIGGMPPAEFEANWLSQAEDQPLRATTSDDLGLGGMTTAVDCDPRGNVLVVLENQ